MRQVHLLDSVVCLIQNLITLPFHWMHMHFRPHPRSLRLGARDNSMPASSRVRRRATTAGAWRCVVGYERAQMKPMAASIAPTTASKTIIRIGDLGGAGAMSDVLPPYHSWPTAASVGNIG